MKLRYMLMCTAILWIGGYAFIMSYEYPGFEYAASLGMSALVVGVITFMIAVSVWVYRKLVT